MVRRELREHIFKMLFQIEFNEMEDMPEHLTLYFENLPSAAEEDKEYIKDKFEAIVKKVPEIDIELNEKTTGWKTTRMSKVDLTILRLAVYEMKWDADVPEGVAINEAVELAKDFGGEDESPRFVNGVLGRIAKRLEGESCAQPASEASAEDGPASEGASTLGGVQAHPASETLLEERSLVGAEGEGPHGA